MSYKIAYKSDKSKGVPAFFGVKFASKASCERKIQQQEGEKRYVAVKRR